MNLRNFSISFLFLTLLYSIHQLFNECTILTYVQILFLGIFFYTVLSVCLYQETKLFIKTKKITAFQTSLLTILYVFCLYTYYTNKKNTFNTQSLFIFYKYNDINGTKIDLKINGKYIIEDFSNFGNTFYYGHYKFNDSIVSLHGLNEKKFPYNRFYYSDKEKCFYPIKKSEIEYQNKYSTQ